jgi:hypothetical protein
MGVRDLNRSLQFGEPVLGLVQTEPGGEHSAGRHDLDDVNAVTGPLGHCGADGVGPVGPAAEEPAVALGGGDRWA